MEKVIVNQGDGGLWCGELYFPLFNGKLYSPITGKSLPSSHSLMETLSKHLAWAEKNHLELKSLPLWQAYVEVRRDLGENISYENFKSHYLEKWANEGYSKTLLTYPAPKGGRENEEN